MSWLYFDILQKKVKIIDPILNASDSDFYLQIKKLKQIYHKIN
jgi:hypothetical protein